MAATSAMMRGFGAHEYVFPQSFMRNAAESSDPGDSLVAMLASSCSNMGSLQVVTPHVALGGSLEDAVIGHTRRCGQKRQALFDYPSFDSCSSSPPVELLYEAVDEEYGAAAAGADELQFMCSSPSSSNNIVESKKRRLTFEQVRSLETNFELDNKLEPERKMQLAMELGLQPRQVAVWFQNRRARWKTKQLERDYEVLSLDYSRLKAQFESIVQEKESLKTEVMVLQQLDHEEQSTSCTADQDSCSNSSDIPNSDSPGTTTTTKTTIHTSLNMLLPPPSQLVVMLTPDQGNSCSPGLHNIFTAPPAAAVDKISTFTVPDPLADHSCNNFFLSQLDVEKATAAAAASGAVCNSMLWWDTWS
ncbi:unnamed protein product [Sphagnum jensenii]|uniref:Homeobox domain-containing protein n=1 Tax=Sphagnum jensenii TaxID=128206 RepID=A0ABP0WM84_9BRYO